MRTQAIPPLFVCGVFFIEKDFGLGLFHFDFLHLELLSGFLELLFYFLLVLD